MIDGRGGITIGDDVWIGAHAVITAGVRTGSHSVLAAGAVVTRDLPEFTTAAGGPAEVIGDRRTQQLSGEDGRDPAS